MFSYLQGRNIMNEYVGVVAAEHSGRHPVYAVVKCIPWDERTACLTFFLLPPPPLSMCVCVLLLLVVVVVMVVFACTF